MRRLFPNKKMAIYLLVAGGLVIGTQLFYIVTRFQYDSRHYLDDAIALSNTCYKGRTADVTCLQTLQGWSYVEFRKRGFRASITRRLQLGVAETVLDVEPGNTVLSTSYIAFGKDLLFDSKNLLIDRLDFDRSYHGKPFYGGHDGILRKP